MKLSYSIFSFIISLIIVLQACEKEGGNKTNISELNSKKSHNMGQNCMNCHKNGGEGEGWFLAAGTVYDSLKTTTYPNTTVKLFTGPNGTGTLKHTIQVDGLGNFYTTETIDFGSGLYPAVVGINSTKYMSSSTTNGQCNSCHGSSTDKIFAN